MKTAIFPGSFDPFTRGHEAIVEKALHLFDKVIIGIGSNVAKKGLLSVENRKRLIDDYYAGDARVEAMIYGGMTGDFAQQVGAAAVIRGVRNTTDFEYERTMAATNGRHLLVDGARSARVRPFGGGVPAPRHRIGELSLNANQIKRNNAMMEFTAEMIAGFLGGDIVGDKTVKVHTVSSIEEGKAGSMAYLVNPKYEPFLYTTEASIVLVDRSFTPQREVKPTLVKVDDAGAAVLRLLEMYNAARPQKKGVSERASISPEASLGEGCYVGDFAVIEAGARIGDGCRIYPQVYVGDGVEIGEGTTLYPGVKIYEGCRIGSRCILHAGAVIGADGFGFAPNAEGGFDKIPQLGNVIIEDDVEIGANTCIDRAKTDSTIIRRGVKLDNLIQVGHNVQIGEHTVSSAQMGIAGSSKIGRNCFLAGQVGIADHVTIGDRVKIGSQSGVDKNVPDGEVRMGTPALPGIKFHRANAVFRNLPELQQRLSALEKAVNQLIEK